MREVYHVKREKAGSTSPDLLLFYGVANVMSQPTQAYVTYCVVNSYDIRKRTFFAQTLQKETVHKKHCSFCCLLLKKRS